MTYIDLPTESSGKHCEAGVSIITTSILNIWESRNRRLSDLLKVIVSKRYSQDLTLGLLVPGTLLGITDC